MHTYLCTYEGPMYIFLLLDSISFFLLLVCQLECIVARWRMLTCGIRNLSVAALWSTWNPEQINLKKAVWKQLFWMCACYCCLFVIVLFLLISFYLIFFSLFQSNPNAGGKLKWHWNCIQFVRLCASVVCFVYAFFTLHSCAPLSCHSVVCIAVTWVT